MIKIPRMLLIGSTGRNTGKTELACGLIRRYAKDQQAIGIKITTITQKDGNCPRGGKGCGVCADLEGKFDIKEELDNSLDKDTSKMLKAGAYRVYWVRSLKKYLNQAIKELLQKIKPDQIIICESTTLRRVIEPGIFILVHNKETKHYKPSARAVQKYSPHIIELTHNNFKQILTDINLANKRWYLKIQATAIILAGGKSKRMGINKGMLSVQGKPLIEHIYNQLSPFFKQILISADNKSAYSFMHCPVIPDRIHGYGPLMGLSCTLPFSEYDINFVIGCDVPEINMDFVLQMIAEINGNDGIIPRNKRKQIEPLFAVYRKKILDVINNAMDRNNRRLRDVLKIAKIKYIKLEDESWLKNLNTREDYEEYIAAKAGVLE